MKYLVLTFFVAMFAAPAMAESHVSGDAQAGKKAFRQCKSCHAVVAGNGDVLVKGGKTGPNLYAIGGRALGSDENFTRYKKGLIAAGEAGIVWEEANFLEWLADPSGYLKTALDDPSQRSSMTFKLRKAADGPNLWAYLDSLLQDGEGS